MGLGSIYRTKSKYPELAVKMNRDNPVNPIPMYLSGNVWVPCSNLYIEEAL